MKKTIAVIVLLVGIAGIACANETSLIGIIIGKSIEENNMPECNVEKHVGNMKWYAFRQESICWQEPMVPYDKTKKDIVGIRVNSVDYLSFVTSTYIYVKKETGDFRTDKIIKIRVMFDPDRAPLMLDLLKKEFGKPLEEKTSVVQNGMGAKFDRLVASWIIDGHALFFDSRQKMKEAVVEMIHKDLYNSEMEKFKKSKNLDKDRL